MLPEGQGLRSRCARRGWGAAPWTPAATPCLGGCAGVSRRGKGREVAPFVVEDVALELFGVLRPLVQRFQGRDRALADQLRRAASSVVLNIGEVAPGKAWEEEA